jgi:quinone-modifying oxidoreductase subunit QmoA
MNTAGKPILVIGGGIAGMTAAVEAAEVGHRVVLVEREACLGGRVLKSHRYFPKMCPPACGFEINVRRIRANPRIQVHTLATVEEVTGRPGNFLVRIRVRPRYVTGTRPLPEGLAEGLASERPDDVNLGMSRTKAIYFPHPFAWPAVPVLDRTALSEADARKIRAECPKEALDLDMKERLIDLDAGAIIVATGWRPYDAAKIENLGFGRLPNVVTNVMLERMAAPSGPTKGEIRRPSDGGPAQNVAFVQCAGSRDEKHLPYCSAVCCTATLKQIRYLKERSPTAKATVFYIDIRVVGRLEKLYYDLLDDPNVTFVKGKAAKISGDADSGDLLVDVEDTIAGENLHRRFDLVVLATGIVPNAADLKLPLPLTYDPYGFVVGSTEGGVFAAGCARHPCDVSRSTKESTAAALKAIQSLAVEG